MAISVVKFIRYLQERHRPSESSSLVLVNQLRYSINKTTNRLASQPHQRAITASLLVLCRSRGGKTVGERDYTLSLGSSVTMLAGAHGSQTRWSLTAPQEPQALVPSPAAPHFGQLPGFILSWWCLVLILGVSLLGFRRQ